MTGRASTGRPGAERYTTTGQLDLEEYLLAEARREVAQRVEPEAAVASLADTDLDETQREVAAGLLASRRAVEVLVAPAGTGQDARRRSVRAGLDGLDRPPGDRADDVHERRPRHGGRGPGRGVQHGAISRASSPVPSGRGALCT